MDPKFTCMTLFNRKYSLLYLSKKPLVVRPLLSNKHQNSLTKAFVDSEINSINRMHMKEMRNAQCKATSLIHKAIEDTKKSKADMISQRVKLLPKLTPIDMNKLHTSNDDSNHLEYSQDSSSLSPARHRPKLTRNLKMITISKLQESLDNEIKSIESKIHNDNQEKILDLSKKVRDQRIDTIRQMCLKKLNKKIYYGRNLIKQAQTITYTRESLEKLADNNSMRYFDSYKNFLREYHQQIIMGLLAPSSKLRYRTNLFTQKTPQKEDRKKVYGQ